jgi:hypothetical protein
VKPRTRKRFWTARLIFVVLNAPLIALLQWKAPDLLVAYLVWMSWATWLSSELPTGKGGEE